jgi:hypothetical protein
MNEQEAKKLRETSVEKIARFNREFQILGLPEDRKKELAILIEKYAVHGFMTGFAQAVINPESEPWGFMFWDVVRNIGGAE